MPSCRPRENVLWLRSDLSPPAQKSLVLQPSLVCSHKPHTKRPPGPRRAQSGHQAGAELAVKLALEDPYRYVRLPAASVWLADSLIRLH